jgi:hypothetical protein
MSKEKGYITGPNWVHISTIPLLLGKKPFGEAKHTPKWDRCVSDVNKKGKVDSPYAICTAKLGKDAYEKEKKEAASATTQVAQLRGDKKKESQAQKNTQLYRFRETSVDPYKSHIFKVTLIKEGLGNLKDRFFYTKQALQNAATQKLFEGVQSFVDHPTAIQEELQPERSTRDILGYYQNVEYLESEDGQGQLLADLCVATTVSQDQILALLTNSVDYATKFKERDLIGLSINASGPAETVGLEDFIASQKVSDSVLAKLVEARNEGITEINIVNELTEVQSVDLVTKAGAGGRVNRMVEKEIKNGKAK